MTFSDLFMLVMAPFALLTVVLAPIAILAHLGDVFDRWMGGRARRAGRDKP